MENILNIYEYFVMIFQSLSAMVNDEGGWRPFGTILYQNYNNFLALGVGFFFSYIKRKETLSLSL